MQITLPPHVKTCGGTKRTLLVSAIAVVLSYASLGVIFFSRLWRSEHYGFFPLVLVAVSWLLWTRIGVSTAGAWRWPALLPLAAGWLLLGLAVWLWSPWLAVISALFTALAFLLRASPRTADVLPVWLLLWLIVPPPLGWDGQLVSALQGLSAQWGSYVLDFMQYDHLLSGHVIEVPGQRFLVEEACSGIRSLFMLFACTAIFAVWQRLSWWHAALLLLSAVFWAVVVNVLRVTAVVIVSTESDFDVASGWSHELLGAGLFVVALLLVWSTDRLLLCLAEPIARHDDDELEHAEVDEEPHAEVHEGVPSPASRPVMLTVITCALFPILGAAQLTLLIFNPADRSVNFTGAGEISNDLGEELFPTEMLEWQRIAFKTERRGSNSIWGEHSRLWTYQRDATRAILSFDYPFLGHHPLVNCYESQGWIASSRAVVGAPSESSNGEMEIEQYELTKETGERALLLISHFDHHGQPLKPSSKSPLSLEAWTDGIARRMKGSFGAVDSEQVTYQFQLLLTEDDPPALDERNDARELFFQARSILQSALLTELGRHE
ncbi:MAG: exosortase U [Planctomycetia bacterium]|nr:exosortase U [Planctomycetia bacterium]